MNNKVAAVKCSNYDIENVLSAVKKAIQLAGLPDVKGKKILLKPNLLSGSDPKKAVTTHPAVLEAVILALQEKGAGKIVVGDSPAVVNSFRAAEKAGLIDVVKRCGVEWDPFEKTGKLVLESDPLIQALFQPAQIVNEVDMIFSLPKMKTHMMMYMTGAMKNLFGVFPGLEKSKFHFRYPEKQGFASLIVDLNRALKPSYAIMDGIIGMEGQGPANGEPKEIGVILASENILAIDIIASQIMNYKPEDIPTIFYGLNGDWLDSIDKVELVGEKLEDVVVKDFKKQKVKSKMKKFAGNLPKFLYKALEKFMIPPPRFNHKKCIRCLKCTKICPAKALTLNERKKIAIDKNKCISCYCCDEVCPVEAISIPRARVK